MINLTQIKCNSRNTSKTKSTPSLQIRPFSGMKNSLFCQNVTLKNEIIKRK